MLGYEVCFFIIIVEKVEWIYFNFFYIIIVEILGL